MRSQWKTAGVALAGAVALASAAYGIGTEAGGGTASAARDAGPPARGFDNLADKLGVDAGELRDALMDFGERQHAKHEDDFAQALADALGKPVDRVKSALEDARPDGRAEGLRAMCNPGGSLRKLANALDVTPAELRKALRQVRENESAEHQARRDDLAEFLADRFNLSKDKVEQALPDMAWPPDRLHFRGPGGPPMPPPPGWPGG
jgi:ClpA/ClpB-like protein